MLRSQSNANRHFHGKMTAESAYPFFIFAFEHDNVIFQTEISRNCRYFFGTSSYAMGFTLCNLTFRNCFVVYVDHKMVAKEKTVKLRREIQSSENGSGSEWKSILGGESLEWYSLSFVWMENWRLRVIQFLTNKGTLELSDADPNESLKLSLIIFFLPT